MSETISAQPEREATEPARQEGGCHCGAVRYVMTGGPLHGGQALCHCTDCRRCSGAPMVGWVMVMEDALTILSGTPQLYESSQHGRRWFCSTCGTGLFYRNAEVLPGLVDIQGATFDDPNAVPATGHIMVAERIHWMRDTTALPEFEHYPDGA